jgi:hypothetical protein
VQVLLPPSPPTPPGLRFGVRLGPWGSRAGSGAAPGLPWGGTRRWPYLGTPAAHRPQFPLVAQWSASHIPNPDPGRGSRAPPAFRIRRLTRSRACGPALCLSFPALQGAGPKRILAPRPLGFFLLLIFFFFSHLLSSAHLRDLGGRNLACDLGNEVRPLSFPLLGGGSGRLAGVL